MKGKGEESRNRVSTEETVKPGTTAGEAFEHDLDDISTIQSHFSPTSPVHHILHDQVVFIFGNPPRLT